MIILGHNKDWRPRVFRSKVDGTVAVEEHRNGESVFFLLVYAGPIAIRMDLLGKPLTYEFVRDSQGLDFEELVPETGAYERGYATAREGLLNQQAELAVDTTFGQRFGSGPAWSRKGDQ